MKINIDGVGTVNVGDEFDSMSPDEQNEFVAHIHEQANAGKKSGIPTAPVSTTEDVLRSGGAGLARGVAGLPGMPGDIQQLAKLAPWAPKRSMMDALLEKVGMDHLPTSDETIKATSNYLAGPKNLSNLVTGENPKSFMDYQPQTKAGEYAKTAGEFIPGAMVGEGGLAKNAIRYGAIPGMTAQAADDFTKGSELEPYGKAIGGVFGSLAGPKLANVPGRIVSPVTQRPEIKEAVKLLESEGVPLTAGQRTGSAPLRWMEAAAADMPFSAKSAADINAEQGSALNRAFADRMGHNISNNEGLMTPDEWQAAKDNLGNRYSQLNSRSTMRHDTQLGNDINQAAADYQSVTSDANRAPIVQRWADAINNLPNTHNGVLPGDIYQDWRSGIAKHARQAGYGSREEYALNEMKRSLDDAMNRSTSPLLAPIRNELNRDYANYKGLEAAATGAGESAAQGYIPSARVRAEAAKRKSQYLTGNSDLGEVAKSAQAVMKPMPSSGTAQRSMYQKLFTPTSAGIGGMIAGIPGAIAGAVVPTIASRALMSGPMQAYLGNQAATRLGLLSLPTKQQKAIGLLNALHSSTLDQ